MVAAGFAIATMVMQRAVFSLVVASDGVAALVAAAVLAARLATTAPVHLRIGTWVRGQALVCGKLRMCKPTWQGSFAAHRGTVFGSGTCIS